MLISPETQLDAGVRIAVLEPLRRVNAALQELLAGFDADDWGRPTVHRDRDVKDLTAHLLHGSVRRVSSLRDGYRRPIARQRPSVAPAAHDDVVESGPPSLAEVIRFVQRDNRAFMNGMRRVSPGILCELIARYDPEVVALFEAQSPDAPGLGVLWAGEQVSRNWFDAAREYTEKWHHQQQLRDATGRPPLYEPTLLVPVLETFARGLPFAYRTLEAPTGASIAISVGAPGSVSWNLRRAGDAWSLWTGVNEHSTTEIVVGSDLLWRLWTKGIAPQEARGRMEITGDRAYAEPLLNFVAILA